MWTSPAVTLGNLRLFYLSYEYTSALKCYYKSNTENPEPLVWFNVWLIILESNTDFLNLYENEFPSMTHIHKIWVNNFLHVCLPVYEILYGNVFFQC